MKIENNYLTYRWEASEPNFVMPVDILVQGKKTRIQPTRTWTKSKLSIKSLSEIEVLKNDFLVD